MKKRKVVALTILILGTTAALIINSKAENSKNQIIEGDYGNFETNNLDYGKKSTTDEDFITANLTDINVTETVASAYLEGFFKKNQNLLGNPQGLTDEINADLNDLDVPKNIEGIALPFKPFEKGAFPVIADNSPAAQLAYLEKIGGLISKNFSEINGDITQIIDRWLDKKDSNPLENYIAGAEQQIKDLQKITVPANWEQSHLQNLNLWQKKTVVYQAILQSENDPLKAYIAVQAISDIIQENDSLQEIISEKYLELTGNR